MTAFSQALLYLAIGFGLSFLLSLAFDAHSAGRAGAPADAPPIYHRLAVVLLLLGAGPYALAREAGRAQDSGEWPQSYLAGAYGMSALWAMTLGFAVVNLVIG